MGGWNQSNYGTAAFIGTGCANNIGSSATGDNSQLSAIVGGYTNCISGSGYSFIGGGYDNHIEISSFSSIVGGCQNEAKGSCSFVGAGRENCACGGTSTVSGGYSCLLYTSPSPRDRQKSRMPSSA